MDIINSGSNYEITEEDEYSVAEICIITWNEVYKGTDKEYNGTVQELVKEMREKNNNEELE